MAGLIQSIAATNKNKLMRWLPADPLQSFSKLHLLLKEIKMQNSIATSAAVVNASAQAAPQVTTVLSAHSNSIVQQLDALSTKREAWETTDFKKANEGLYNLLSECLGVFHSQFVNASEEDRKSLRASLAELLTVKGVRVLKKIGRAHV